MKNQVMSLNFTQSRLYTATLISYFCSGFMFNFGYCLRQSPHSSWSESSTGNHVSTAEQTDT